MHTTFFTAIAAALAGTQHRINVAIESAPADALKVMITADLGPTPEQASSSEVQLRTAMCRPLLLVGNALEIEASLLQRLTQHVQALNEGVSLLEEIRSIGSAAQANAATKAAELPASPAAETEADSEADEAEQADGNSVGSTEVPAQNLAASF